MQLKIALNLLVACYLRFFNALYATILQKQSIFGTLIF